MGNEHLKDLLKFLKPFRREVQETALWLRNFVWDLYPNANELIYDNYNAVAFGWSISDKLSDSFCSVAVMRTNQHILFGFYWGAKIEDPEGLLIGNGSQFRYLVVNNLNAFPEKEIKKLIKAAYAYSLNKMKPMKDLPEGTTTTKSISPVRRTATKKTVAKKIVVKKTAKKKTVEKKTAKKKK